MENPNLKKGRNAGRITGKMEWKKAKWG